VARSHRYSGELRKDARSALDLRRLSSRPLMDYACNAGGRCWAENWRRSLSYSERCNCHHGVNRSDGRGSLTWRVVTSNLMQWTVDMYACVTWSPSLARPERSD